MAKDKRVKQLRAWPYISVQEDGHHGSKLSIPMDVVDDDTRPESETNGEWPRVALGWISPCAEKEAWALRR